MIKQYFSLSITIYYIQNNYRELSKCKYLLLNLNYSDDVYSMIDDNRYYLYQ